MNRAKADQRKQRSGGWSLLVGLIAAAVGCSQPQQPTETVVTAEAVVTATAGPSAHPSAQSAQVPAAVVVKQVPSTAPGPAYVLVDHTGVLKLTATGSETIVPAPSDGFSLFTEMVLSPSQTLWLSDWQGIRLHRADDTQSKLRSVKDGPLLQRLTALSPTSAWAATSDIEWRIMHFDGAHWSAVRKRSDFPGSFSDNKLSGLAVASGAVWVSCWNGLWRGRGDDWQPIELPEGLKSSPDLLVYRDQLMLIGAGGYYLRTAAGWKELARPERADLQVAVSDLGFMAAPHSDAPKIAITSLTDGSTTMSAPLQGRDVHALAIDAAARIWAGTDRELAVMDRQGKVLARWAAGALPGLTGRIIGIAVAGAGPQKLPAARQANAWTVRGRLKTYKSSSALKGATVSLCTAISTECADDPQAMRATTGPDGSFIVSGVPEAQLWIHVKPPAGVSDCRSPFTRSGRSLVPARDCKSFPGAPNECNIGDITVCQPFEMPPVRVR